MYEAKGNLIKRMYKQGYSKNQIAGRLKTSWQSVDRVIQGYLYETEETQASPKKPKRSIGGRAALYVLLLLALIIGIWVLVNRWCDRQSQETRKKPDIPKTREFENRSVEKLDEDTEIDLPGEDLPDEELPENQF